MVAEIAADLPMDRVDQVDDVDRVDKKTRNYSRQELMFC